MVGPAPVHAVAASSDGYALRFNLDGFVEPSEAIFEAKHTRLRALDEKMGHNGLLIVMASRLMHFLPFGVSNYLFGITRITLMDVILGTFLGNAPAIAFYVAVGAM